MKLGRLWIIVALSACGGGGSTNNNALDGALNGHCYPNNTCNAGLTCSGGVCEMGIDIDAAIHDDSTVVIVDGPGHPDSAVLPDAFVNPDGGVMLIDGSTPDAASTPCNILTQAGCNVGEKCTWILETDPTASGPGLGQNGCAPNGAVAVGGACTINTAAMGGYDNCIKASACVSAICKSICDNNGGTPTCTAAQACVTYQNLFANSGAPTPAGVCDPACNPLDDNDFDGSGTAFSKTGITCGSSSTVGCYGTPSSSHVTFFTCSAPVSGTELLTHRSPIPPANQFINACMSGYTIAFAGDATGSNIIDCYAWCKPGDAYQGMTGTPAPNGLAPHRCNTSDALGAFGTTPTSVNNGTNGEHCMYSWRFEVDAADTLHISPTSNTVGICWDHTKYQYDSNGDGTPDTTVEACTTRPLTQPSGSLLTSAVDFGCVSTTTAGLSFTGKPTLHRHYIANLPEIPALQKR